MQAGSLIENALNAFADGLQQAVDLTTEKPSDWIQREFYVPDPRDPITGKFIGTPGPIILAQHQCDIIDEALSKTPDGTFKYTTIVYSAPKKSGKSAVTSAIVKYMAHHYPNSYLACLANDERQANSRLYGPIFTSYRYHRQLGGTFKDESPNLGRVRLTNNTIIESVPVDAAGEAGSQPLMTAWCYDEETEVLTKAGWKKYNEYTTEDKIATLSPVGLLEYQHPIAVNVQKYEGKMHLLETRHGSICVSPNHNMYGKFYNHNKHKKDSEFEKQKIESLYDYTKYAVRVESLGCLDASSYPETVLIDGTKRKPAFSVPIELYLKLLGWYLSEGCTHKKEAILIAQTEQSEYYQEIKDLVTELGYIPRMWNGTDAIVIYDTRLAKHFSVFGLAHEKFIPAWVKELPQRLVDIMLDTYYKGDGCKTYNGGKGRRYSTNSDQLRDDLLEIHACRGDYVTSTTYQDKRWGRPVHSITAKDHQDGERCIGIPTKYWQQIDYDGYIHCPSVPNGVIVVRRRGKVYFGGNSELWGYETPNKRRMWTEMTVPPTLYGHAIRWVESYAGYTGVSELLETLYNTGFTRGEPHPDFLHLQGRDGPVVRVNERAGMFVYWDTEHRMPWQTPAYYREQAETMPSTEFDRIHNNMWVSPLDSFIREEWWDGCENPDLPELTSATTPVVVGIDMAETGDCAALVAVTRDPFAPDTNVAVRAVRIFNPKRLGGIIDQEKDVRPVIEEWAKNWNVVCWVYDPREMSKLAQDLTRDGLGWFRKFGQTNPRAVADKALYDMVISKQLSWNRHTTLGDIGFAGDSQSDTLRKHITLAGANTTNEARRLIKLSNMNKIDAAVALSQASQIAMELAIGNDEFNVQKLIRQYQKRELTEQEFSQRVRQANPKLVERLAHDHRRIR